MVYRPLFLEKGLMSNMVFEYKKWVDFCKKLHDANTISIPANEVNVNSKHFIVLKHDVETDVQRAFELAKIEHRFGHRGSFYVQAYLMQDKSNIELLKKMKKMGHEISYHYDVMDSNKGDLDKAISEFEENRRVFERNGFHIITVCQHGNPVVERVGYTSNRDFFRSNKVKELYPEIADIMVDYKEKHQTNYIYYSDAGRKFSTIYDPIYNDIINSDDKNIKYEDLDEVFEAVQKVDCAIISTHPHRWTRSALEYYIKNFVFKTVKTTAKLFLHIPGMKKIMGRYYYLAKKI